ncbi:hypothetical protein [Paenalcaligenes suwonensis]|uniref:hypothetical protein n=1 Tax=Paenalcaligenes suwonensis TaxID=1202713 RepID=UPI00140DCBA7|nr:hypothetical protein [Paenalcaligenes suwonensis]NHC62900.1 hypothetical protein [Paenalcaligenes suwonensis]
MPDKYKALRDQFAIAALTSGEAASWRDNDWTPHNGKTVIENMALCAYDIADAMLKARGEGESGD